MGTQTKIAAQIIDQNGDDALALKDHQENLSDEVKATFALAEKDGFVDHRWESDRQVEKGHGRIEIREQWTLSDPEILAYLDPERKWKGLRGIGVVRAERRMEHKTTKETRSFLLSFSSVKTFATAVRSHWGIGAIRFTEMSESSRMVSKETKNLTSHHNSPGGERPCKKAAILGGKLPCSET